LPAPCKRAYCFHFFFQMVLKSISSQKNRKLDFRKTGHELFSPGSCTLRTGRQIPGAARTRIAESHRNDRKKGRIVKLSPGNSKPASQALPAWVIKRLSTGVHPNPR